MYFIRLEINHITDIQIKVFKIMNRILIFGLMMLSNICIGQTIQVEGYTYQEGNRGYLSDVYVRLTDSSTGEILAETKSDIDGFFSCSIIDKASIKVFADKPQFKLKELDMDRLQGEEKLFVKIEMSKEPGYSFEVTLAEKKKGPGIPTDAITGALIEIYNNTKREPVLVIKDNVDPDFDVNFQKGNHYTVLIRKPGFLSKRMEAYVDVEGCILCFEGIGNVRPGVADNLTDRNAAGVLLANVELEPIFEGKTLEIENIYYDLGKYNITKKSREQLKKVILLMEDNPNLKLELGSHTDSRGNNKFNKELSEKRAKASVSYIVNNSGIGHERVISRGYGEDIILNECRDGVICTEAQHSINRRTELKIIGIGELGQYKPLAQMKAEEFFEKGLISQDEIRVGANETLEEVLERQFNKGDTVPNDIIVETEMQVVETPKIDKEIVNEVEQIVEEEIVDTLILVDTQDYEIKENINDSIEKGIMVTDIEKVIEKKSEIDTTATTDNISEYTAALDGVKVVIKKATERLDEDVELFKRHENLEVYIADDYSIWYMMGGFENKEQADDALHSFIKITYPDAHVVVFEKGKIK